MKIKCLTHNTRPVHWLANPDESEQAVHFGSFAPALASLIFNLLCRWATVNATADCQIQINEAVICKRKKKTTIIYESEID